ncbi:MAG: cysteine desulfurase family protein [Acidimicrobiales bacterium]
MAGPPSDRRAYLDHASTTPARPEVVCAMGPWLGGAADPGRVYSEGRKARAAVEEAREQVAGLLGARPREVVFTSGATEAVATACRGGREWGDHQVIPAVEHSAVRDQPGENTLVGVDRDGRVDPEAVAAAIRPGRTGLVHLQLANHEVGTIQPVEAVAAICRDRRVALHVDAAAAAGHIPIDFAALGVDLMSVSAHKLGGPTGVGALIVRRGVRVPPLLVGGAQERGRRAGLENLAAIVGFGAAAAALAGPEPATGPRGESVNDPGRGGANGPRSATVARVAAGHRGNGGTGGARAGDAWDVDAWDGDARDGDARDGDARDGDTPRALLHGEGAQAWAQTEAILAAALEVEGVEAYGHRRERLPHLICIGIDGVVAEGVLVGLDRRGVAAHSGSACSSEVLEPSPVLAAMGLPADRSLRLSVGWSTRDEDVALFAHIFGAVVTGLRSLASGPRP